MKSAKFKYSVVSIRNIYGVSHLTIIDSIKSGYVSAIGDGENIDSYYTNSKGLAYLKRLVGSGEVGSVGVSAS